jgi:hypothetical protein
MLRTAGRIMIGVGMAAMTSCVNPAIDDPPAVC